AANQTAVVPTTQPGTYYILIRGQSEPGANTPVKLLASLEPFGISDVLPDSGGDSGFVTTTILGARFDPQAVVKLVRPGFAEYEPASYKVVDGTRILATFDLRNAPHGLYDLRVTNPDGHTALVPYRYLVQRGIEPDVTIGLGGPRDLFPSNLGLYQFTIQSQTNVDTPYVFFQFGIPNLGPGTPDPTKQSTKLVFQTDLRGGPQGAAGQDLPWASLDAAVNTTGEVLAPGYVLDLPDRGATSLTFTAQTYPWLARLRIENPVAFANLLDPKQLRFRFHILAS